LDAARVLGKLQALDLEGLVADLRTAARGVSRASGRIDEAGQGLPRTLESMDRALGAIRDAARSLEREIPNVAGDARGAMQRLAAALDQLDGTLREVKLTLSPGAPVPAQLEQTLREVGQAARSLRVLADSLERDPSQIVRGRPEAKP
jgi:paraquat-inducible protein B